LLFLIAWICSAICGYGCCPPWQHQQRHVMFSNTPTYLVANEGELSESKPMLMRSL
jgi:hypothetical protein